jgi:hypothetical protein
MELAWGIVMTGFTLFGMAALVIMSATTDEQKSDSAMRYTDEPAAVTTETRKAA